MITIVDYHLNNLRSLENSFRRLGHATHVTSDAEGVRTADKIVLPGVGAFPDAMRNLAKLGLDTPIVETARRGVPILGVCLGMHLLFEGSEEFGSHMGLGLLKGRVQHLPGGAHVPHMGWNQLHPRRNHPLLGGVEEGSFVYFVHSYYAAPSDPDIVLASTDYGIDFPAIVGTGRIWATQFHPEKSQHVGERILDNFARS